MLRRPAGRGKKNNLVRIRNRRYKIKRTLAQPRNTDVRRNGRVVRKIVLEEAQSILVQDVGENINCKTIYNKHQIFIFEI